MILLQHVQFASCRILFEKGNICIRIDYHYGFIQCIVKKTSKVFTFFNIYVYVYPFPCVIGNPGIHRSDC